MTIDDFISRVDGFVDLKPSEQIPFFGYYLIHEKGIGAFSSKDIDDCFTQSFLSPYSNISAFLSKSSKQKDRRILKSKNGGYVLSRNEMDRIESLIGKVRVKQPSNDLFSMDIFDNTRHYLQRTARQVIICYDYEQYDACFVMIRRLIETLIIEIFEVYGEQERIKGKDGHYLFCGDLIDKLLEEKTKWTIGRNTEKELPIIKKIADNCAHNRRFNANRGDVDKIKLGLRISLEELVHLAHFHN